MFLDPVATQFIYKFSTAAHLLTGNEWQPFAKKNFAKTAQLNTNSASAEIVKKLLYNRGIPFDQWVFILPNYNNYPVLATWKMVIKYSATLFLSDDVKIFDATLNWCVFFFHEGCLFWGKDNVYDAADDQKRIEEMNERKRKSPDFKHPFL